MCLTVLCLVGWSVLVGALGKDENNHALKNHPDLEKSYHLLEELTDFKLVKCTFCGKQVNTDFQQFVFDFAKGVAKQKSSEQFTYALQADYSGYVDYYGLSKEHVCNVETGPINIVQELVKEKQELHRTNYFHNDQSEPLLYTVEMPFVFNVESTNIRKNWLTWYPPWETCTASQSNNIHVIKEWRTEDTFRLLGPLQSNFVKAFQFILQPNETEEINWYVKTYKRITVWEMDVRFRGDIRINTRDGMNNSQWHRYALGAMARDKSSFRRDGYDLLYTVSGVLISTYTSDDDIWFEPKIYQEQNGSRNEYSGGIVEITPLTVVEEQEPQLNE